MGSFLEGCQDLISTFRNQLFGPCTVQRPLMLAVFLKIFTLGFRLFYVWLRVYNLQKLMQLMFGGQFMLGLKWAQNRVF